MIDDQIEYIKSLHSTCGTEDGGIAKEKFESILYTLEKYKLIIDLWEKIK